MKFNLGELDLSDIYSWPKPARVLFVALICMGVAFLIYLFDIRPQAEIKRRLEIGATEALAKAKALYLQGQSLPALRNHIKKQEKALKSALRQLPRTTEMPSLLEDISRTGLASGLELRAFQPTAEVNKDFYVELPVDITAQGGYHAIGRFVSDVANLQRLATFHDFKITADKDERLIVKIMAKTYYHDDQKPAAPLRKSVVEKGP